MSWVAVAIGGSALVGGVVGATTASQNRKASQPAPDYADATRAGIEADAATLPFRLAINNAAQQGTVYTDPSTGKVYDFRGTFDAARFFAQHPQARQEWDEERAKGELQGWTEEDFAAAYLGGRGTADLSPYFTGSSAYRTQNDIDNATQLMTAGTKLQDESVRNQLQSYLDLLPQFNNLNLAQQQATIDQAIAASGKLTQNQYDQNLAYLPKFNQLQLDAQKQAFDASLDASKRGTYAQADWQKELLPQLNALSLAEQRKAFDASQAASRTSFAGNLDMADEAARRAAALQQSVLPGLNDLSLRLQGDAYTAGDAVGRRVNGGLYAIRDQYAANLLDELKSGSDLTPAQRNKVQQRIRGAQAARGNILGDGAAFDEAIAESDYAQNLINDRRAAALGLINARDLNPNFSSVGVLNPTQVVAPNLAPANFTAQTAVNPLMPNFAATGVMTPTVPNFQPTTTAMPNLSPAPIQQSNPLGYLNPNAGQQSASYKLNAWDSLSNRIANLPNPWAQGIGAAAKTFSMFSSSGLGAFGGG